eukprot:GHVS01029989.1.p1 GENE.GHVS01029989.1~~GHVS01029989.1.p1  ORF type:complete len:321 (+),score=21.10 GHVS01029989.1:130-1092(+)
MLTIVSRFREVAETAALLHLYHSVCSLTIEHTESNSVPSGVRAFCSSHSLGNWCVKRKNGSTRSVLPAKTTDELSQAVNGSSLGFSIYVDESTLHGLGVFAGRSFEPGEVVEVCPVLELPRVSPELVGQASPVAFRSDPLLGTTERHHSLVGNSHLTALKETMETIADYVFDNGTDSDSDCESSPKVTNTAGHSNSRKVSSDGYSQGGSLLAFGYGMVYNHSNNPNAYSKLVYDYLNVPYRKNEQSEASIRNDMKVEEEVPQERKEVRQKRKVLRIKTLRKIKQGNEIFIHYGDEWWKNRRSVPLSFNFSRFRGTLLDDD